jgi:O-antigen ligase
MPADSFANAFTYLKKNRSWLAIALVAFFMPFYHHWSELTIVLLFIILLTDSNTWKHFMNFTHNRLLYPFILLYLMYGLGMFYTANLNEGWSDMLTMFPLLLFPIFISTLDYSVSGKKNNVMLAFLGGCMAAGLICMGNAVYTWYATGINEFLYTNLSLFMHPSYFALYLNLALCYLYQRLIFGGDTGYFKTPVIISVLFFINLLILMLYSKAGILTAGIVQCTMLTVSIKKRKNAGKAIGIVLGLTLFCFLFYKVVPDNQERIMRSEQEVMTKPLNKASSESSSLRLLIWNSAKPLIKRTFLFGTGTGDVKDELVAVYKSNSIAVALEKELNAHNQFLQTLIAIGLPGLILLILSLASPFLFGVRTGNYLLSMFCFIMAFNFLFESMLERQAGAVFFAFFSSLLVIAGYSDKLADKSKFGNTNNDSVS